MNTPDYQKLAEICQARSVNAASPEYRMFLSALSQSGFRVGGRMFKRRGMEYRRFFRTLNGWLLENITVMVPSGVGERMGEFQINDTGLQIASAKALKTFTKEIRRLKKDHVGQLPSVARIFRGVPPEYLALNVPGNRRARRAYLQLLMSLDHPAENPAGPSTWTVAGGARRRLLPKVRAKRDKLADRLRLDVKAVRKRNRNSEPGAKDMADHYRVPRDFRDAFIRDACDRTMRPSKFAKKWARKLIK